MTGTSPAPVREITKRSRAWLVEIWPEIARSEDCLTYALPLVTLLDRMLCDNAMPLPAEAPPSDPAAPGLAADLARFLARLAGASGAAGSPQPPHEGRLVALFAAGPDGQSQALALVESGPVPAGIAPLAGDLLAGAALRVLRGGDLLTGARFARASRWLRGPRRAFDDMVVSHLVSHQCPDGAFLSRSRIRSPARESPRFVFNLRAAATFHCLWTLAEFCRSGDDEELCSRSGQQML